MINPFKNMSIKFKLVVSVVIVFVVVVMLMAMSFGFAYTVYARASLQKHSKDYLQGMSYMVSPALEANNKQVVAEVVDRMQMKELCRIIVRNRIGVEYYTKLCDDHEKNIGTRKDESLFFIVVDIVSSDGNFLGQLQGDISTRFVLHEVASNMRSILLVTFALVCISILAISFLLGHSLQPLIMLKKAIDKMIERKNIGLVDITTHDEIGELAQSFNTMSKKLKETTVSRDELVREVVERERIGQSLKVSIEQAESTARDLAEANIKLEAAIKIANAATRAKSQFLANMSHELRTPMNAVIGFSDLLRTTQLDEVQLDYIDTINASGAALLGVINDILDLSKVEAGETQLEIIDFNLDQLCSTAAKIVSARVLTDKINFVYEMQNDMPRSFKGDPTRIRQIILNLLGNAVKFTEAGTIDFSVSSEGCKDGAHFVRIAVKDSGIGISKDKLEVIFDTFSQADVSTTRKYGGTGLGLSITRLLVDAMGGKITVSSEEGKGSEFVVVLPLEDGRSAKDTPIDPVPFDALDALSVVVIEDNDHARSIVTKYCQQAKMQVVQSFACAQEACAWLDAARVLPELILCDICMPEMDGYAFAQSIRENDRFASVKLIAISSDVHVGVSHECAQAGFDAYLSKPIVKKEMFRVVQTVLGDKRIDGGIVTRHLAEEFSLKGVRVLIAEDNKINLKLIQIFLNNFGCELDDVDDGEQAIAKLKENPYDIILMDIQMPNMSGNEATRMIRRDINPDIPIVALTAAAMKEDEEKALLSGMNDYITKPVKIERLKEVIAKWVRSPEGH